MPMRLREKIDGGPVGQVIPWGYMQIGDYAVIPDAKIHTYTKKYRTVRDMVRNANRRFKGQKKYKYHKTHDGALVQRIE